MTSFSATNKIPSFGVLDSEGNKIASIEHCFIEHRLLDLSVPPIFIKLDNGQKYQTVYDNIILPQVGEGEINLVKVIVSFQKHDYGSFAVIRNLRANSKS